MVTVIRRTTQVRTPTICLSRKVGQRIILILPDGRRVAVEVAERDGRDLTRLRVTAPEDVGVWREEIAPPCP